jgi:murein DD-endopeptidase MepM/ murein hydrolase activator NlpD
MRTSRVQLAYTVLLVSGAAGVLALTQPAPTAALAGIRRPTSADTTAGVVLHPLHGPHYVCLEHPAGQLRRLGDALGADCSVLDLATGPLRRWPAFYTRAGRRNEDWYGWNVPVLAPFDGTVDSVHINSTVNVPGTLGRARASSIAFHRSDGVQVLYAHMQGIRVRAGDRVRAGQAIARVGNNGPALFPHTHVGAWRGDTALQIRFDLTVMGKLSRLRR